MKMMGITIQLLKRQGHHGSSILSLFFLTIEDSWFNTCPQQFATCLSAKPCLNMTQPQCMTLHSKHSFSGQSSVKLTNSGPKVVQLQMSSSKSKNHLMCIYEDVSNLWTPRTSSLPSHFWETLGFWNLHVRTGENVLYISHQRGMAQTWGSSGPPENGLFYFKNGIEWYWIIHNFGVLPNSEPYPNGSQSKTSVFTTALGDLGFWIWGWVKTSYHHVWENHHPL